jgi:hypothetical protein
LECFKAEPAAKVVQVEKTTAKTTANTVVHPGQNAPYRAKRVAGLSGWSFAAINPAVLLLLRTRYLSVMFFAGWKEKVWIGISKVKNDR